MRPKAVVEEHQVKIFGVVKGVTLRMIGARSGALLTAALPIRTNQGRELTWAATSIADESGNASLRLPYATGENGKVHAGPYVVTDGEDYIPLAIRESAIIAGVSVVIQFPARTSNVLAQGPQRRGVGQGEEAPRSVTSAGEGSAAAQP